MAFPIPDDPPVIKIILYIIVKKMASYLHHTATTKYPCCVPTLGDSEGASCVGLAATKLQSIFRLTNENFLIFCNKIQYTTTHL